MHAFGPEWNRTHGFVFDVLDPLGPTRTAPTGKFPQVRPTSSRQEIPRRGKLLQLEDEKTFRREPRGGNATLDSELRARNE